MLKIIITGGGTGGHLYPGLAIAEEVKKRVLSDILFVGTKRGIEARVIPERGYNFKTVWIGGIKRGRFFTNIGFPLKMVIALIQAMKLVLSFHPQVIVGTGGYVSWPVVMAGILLRKITVIQEQNQQPGLVTRILAGMVHSVHLSFEETVRCFKKKDNLHISGNPTSEALDSISRIEGCKRFKLDPQKIVLFIFGGSQGAFAINQAMIQMVDRIMKLSDVQILWSTGPRWFEEIENCIKPWRDRIHVFPFIQEMTFAYGASDLIVCRAGATTVSEITRIGLPAIFIPFPGATSGHQETNAKVLYDCGAAELIFEYEIPKGKLERILFTLLNNKRIRKNMAINAKKLGKPEASKVIVDDILLKLK